MNAELEVTPPRRVIIDDEYYLAFIRPDWAWYAAANRITGPELDVHAAHPDGGVKWEFSVQQHPFPFPPGQTAIELRMFDDAFDAFADIPWFFTALRQGGVSSVRAVQDILIASGAVDRTERRAPKRAVRG